MSLVPPAPSLPRIASIAARRRLASFAFIPQTNSKRQLSMMSSSVSSSSSSASSYSSDGEGVATPPAEAIARRHAAALRRGAETYRDPRTGFTVWTELAHLRRGQCCGHRCRHCPYGWEEVPPQPHDGDDPPPAKVRSGDAPAIQALLERLRLEVEPDIEDAAIGHMAIPDQVPTMAGAAAVGGSQRRTLSTGATGGRRGGRYTAKNVPYTRGGDTGTAQLRTGERRPKDDAVFEALGDVDELCSVIGLAQALWAERGGRRDSGDARPPPLVAPPSIDLDTSLLEIMSRLFDIGSIIARPGAGTNDVLDERHTRQLEDWIDVLTEALPELRSFVLPTGSVTAAQLHVARTVCRRAERRVVPLVTGARPLPPAEAEQEEQTTSSTPTYVADKEMVYCDPSVLKYLNRLSDFLFAAARWVNLQETQQEVMYRRPTRDTQQRDRVVVSLTEDDTR